MRPTSRLLTLENKAQNEPARLFGLRLNAPQGAVQGRFDDAVAPVCRLVDWTAQWQLRSTPELDTASFPAAKLSKSVDARPDQAGNSKVELFHAWQEIAAHLHGAVQGFAVKRSDELLSFLQIRNNSLVTHGFHPVNGADWRRMEDWVDERFLPMLRVAEAESGLSAEPVQLPTEPPRELSAVV